jgi:dCTP diphosphatase
MGDILEPRGKWKRQNAAAGRGIRYGAGMPTTIEALTSEIRAFRDARDWLQFHNPKELAVAITAEAGELLQHFVWQSPEQANRRVTERRAEIESEIADVAILLFELADNCGIDLAAAMRAKLARNEIRYPVEKARGSNKKYNEL